MPAASHPSDGAPESLSHAREDRPTSQWPLATDDGTTITTNGSALSPAVSGDAAVDDDGSKHDALAKGVGAGTDSDVEQQQGALSSGAGAGDAAAAGGAGSGTRQMPWWKTRKAMWSFAAGGVLLVVLVVLLVLGLLGYLRKVGPFASLVQSASSASTASNPLSTIPLMSDPFANPSSSSSTAIIPSATPTLAQSLPSVSVVSNPGPTNLPTINAVRTNQLPLMWIVWACAGQHAVACSSWASQLV